MKVLNTLKPGLNEKAYGNAMVIELKRRGHTIDQQRPFDVFYEGQLVDKLIPDLLVDSLVIVDRKVVSEFNNTFVSECSTHHSGHRKASPAPPRIRRSAPRVAPSASPSHPNSALSGGLNLQSRAAAWGSQDDNVFHCAVALGVGGGSGGSGLIVRPERGESPGMDAAISRSSASSCVFAH